MENETDSANQNVTDDESHLVDHIGAEIWQAFRAYEKAMFSNIDRMGFEDISVADSAILVLIGPSGTRLVDIARQRQVSKQSAHEQVQSLIRRGYLTVIPDPSDKRAKIIKHSDKGLILVKALGEIKRQLNDQVAEQVGEKGMRTLKRLLKVVRQSVKP